MTLEQAKRLKNVGFPVDMDGHRTGKLYCITTEKDMIDWLLANGWLLQFSETELLFNKNYKYVIIQSVVRHPDLTERLVQAIETVLKEKKEPILT